MTATGTARDRTKAEIIDAATRILGSDGPSAVTTRAVAAAAGVQAPTIYRLFGDKDGLLEAVAEHVMSTFVETKSRVVDEASADGVDPLVDLRSGWVSQLEFGMANPALFRLLSDPARVSTSEAAQSGRRVLERRVRRVAQAGLLRVGEQRAVGLIMAAGTGAIQASLATPVEERDAGLADAMYEAVLAQILVPRGAFTGHSNDGSPALTAAVTLRGAMGSIDALSPAEATLMRDWLDRIIGAEARPETTLDTLAV